MRDQMNNNLNTHYKIKRNEPIMALKTLNSACRPTCKRLNKANKSPTSTHADH